MKQTDADSRKETAGNYPNVLYIDGITGAGKTTLLDGLANEIPDARFIPEFSVGIPEQYRNIGPHLPIADQLRAEFWFYHQYLKKDQEIRQCSGKVIVDRGLLGLFCYSNLLGERQEVSARIMRRASHHQWVPGVYVFLTARPDVIRQRLLSRKDQAAITEQDWENGVGDFIAMLHRSAESVAFEAGINRVDTSDSSPQEVKSYVRALFDTYYMNSWGK